VFASVGDDKMLMVSVIYWIYPHKPNFGSNRWDVRTPGEPTIKFQAHEREILSVVFSLATEHLLLTGSADKVLTMSYCGD
jgi:histone-binding protein RBBP4